jgi:hypothetical protein
MKKILNLVILIAVIGFGMSAKGQKLTTRLFWGNRYSIDIPNGMIVADSIPNQLIDWSYHKKTLIFLKKILISWL